MSAVKRVGRERERGVKCCSYTGKLLSCQPRVTVTSCFVYKVIRDLWSI